VASDDEIETELLFTRPARTIFGRKRFRWFQHEPKIVYAALIGRNVTSDMQTLDTIIDSLSRVRTIESPGNTSGLGSGSGSAIGDGTAVGDVIELDSGNIAGNAAISIPTATPTSFQLWELLQLLWSGTMDGTVATRTPAPLITTGLNSTVQATATRDFSFGVLPSLTASQEGRIFVPRASALLQVNDNGTITTGAASPLPMLFSAQGLVIADVLAAGVAGDTHRISAWCRRVA